MLALVSGIFFHSKQSTGNKAAAEGPAKWPMTTLSRLQSQVAYGSQGQGWGDEGCVCTWKKNAASPPTALHAPWSMKQQPSSTSPFCGRNRPSCSPLSEKPNAALSKFWSALNLMSEWGHTPVMHHTVSETALCLSTTLICCELLGGEWRQGKKSQKDLLSSIDAAPQHFF